MVAQTQNNIIMFDYKYTVKSSDGYEWGLFKTRTQAALMRDALIKNYGQVDYWVEKIK
jgi:hypothetical protein